MPSGTVTPAGGGLSAAQVRALGVGIVRGPFSFAFNTAAITNGVSFYTPTVGDVLLFAWFVVDTAFDGTTPFADFGTFVGTNIGFINSGPASMADLSIADAQGGGTGLLTRFTNNSGGFTGNSLSAREAPAVFTATNPLKVVVSQDGQKGGAAVGGAAGAARIYIVTATPVAF